MLETWDQDLQEKLAKHFAEQIVRPSEPRRAETPGW